MSEDALYKFKSPEWNGNTLDASEIGHIWSIHLSDANKPSFSVSENYSTLKCGGFSTIAKDLQSIDEAKQKVQTRLESLLFKFIERVK